MSGDSGAEEMSGDGAFDHDGDLGADGTGPIDWPDDGDTGPIDWSAPKMPFLPWWIFGGGSMNVIRGCGDLCKIVAIIILFRRLRKSKNAQGISCRTQELYLLVSVTRYTDLLTTFYSVYNSFFKLFYIAAYSTTVCMIRRNEQISASYDRMQDNFPSWKCLVLPCAALAVVVGILFGDFFGFVGYDLLYSIRELLWMFSILLESVAILPQLSLLRRYRVVENLTANYVFFMGLYRALYIANWIYRAYHQPGRTLQIGFTAAVWPCACAGP